MGSYWSTPVNVEVGKCYRFKQPVNLIGWFPNHIHIKPYNENENLVRTNDNFFVFRYNGPLMFTVLSADKQFIFGGISIKVNNPIEYEMCDNYQEYRLNNVVDTDIVSCTSSYIIPYRVLDEPRLNISSAAVSIDSHFINNPDDFIEEVIE